MEGKKRYRKIEERSNGKSHLAPKKYNQFSGFWVPILGRLFGFFVINEKVLHIHTKGEFWTKDKEKLCLMLQY